MAGSSMAGYESTSDSQDHDVFINHRGPDAKDPFATSLYRRLTAKGLQVFLDKPEMQVGHNILSQIAAAIRVASVHIAIFSPRYAESEGCLNELLWMVKTGKTIIPVFYKVKPEHLQRTKWTGTEKDGPYAIALRKHEQEQRHGTETIQRWREALKDVANISGLELEAFNGQEEELLEKVEQSVLEICPPSLDAAKYSTGLRGKNEEMDSDSQESDEAETEGGSEESEDEDTEGDSDESGDYI